MSEIKKVKPKKKRKKTAGSARKWIPSSQQIKLAELLVNPEDRRSKKDKYESIGLTERTFYRWLKDTRFIDYVNSQINKYTDAELPEMWKALINQGKRGNMAAIKMYFELKNKYTPIVNKQQFDEEKLKLEREKFEHAKEMDKLGMF